MTLAVETDGGSRRPDGFDADTERCDATSATIAVSGDLDQEHVPILAGILDAHLAAGRRFLRVSVCRVRRIDPAGAELLAAMHERLLCRRGTLIVTGVRTGVHAALSRLGLADRLFLLAPCADELRD